MANVVKDTYYDKEKKKKTTLTTRGQVTKNTTPTTITPTNVRAVYSKTTGNYVPTITTPQGTGSSVTSSTGNYGGISQDVRNLLPSSQTDRTQGGTGTGSGSNQYNNEYNDILPTNYSITQAVKDYALSKYGGGSSGGSSGSSSGRSSSGSGTSDIKKIYPASGGQTTQQTFEPIYSETPIEQPFQQTQTGNVQYDFSTPDRIYKSYKSELANLRDEELALAAQLNSQFMSQIDSLIAQYTEYYNQMGQGVDPATEAALARLKQEMEQDQKSILEYLNARGIAQSGITIAEFGKLAGQYTDKKSQMLAQRLTDLQNQFLSAMQNFMNQKIQGMGTYTQNAMGIQQQYTQGMQNAMQNAMDMTFGAWQQQQAERAAMEQALIPYTYGMTPHEQAQLSQKQTSTVKNSQSQTATQAKSATNEAIARLTSYPTREAAENSIKNTAQGLVQMGVDIVELYKALDRIFPVNNYSQYFSQ